MKKIFKNVVDKVHKMMEFYRKKTVHITGVTCIGSFLIGTGKLVIGIATLSFFACANAFYTYGVVLAKLVVIKGIYNMSDKHEQCRRYKQSGIILIVASLAYLLYSIKLIIQPVDTSYDMNQGLIIALVTFVEVGFNIRGMMMERKNDNMMYHALRSINFASASISLVLTQTAILSFTSANEGYAHAESANGYLAVIMSILATLVGVFIIYRGTSIEKGKNYRVLVKKMRKFLKTKELTTTLHPKKVVDEHDRKKLLLNGKEIENFKMMKELVWDEFQIELIQEDEWRNHYGQYIGS